ncbi:fructosamine kinase family protein [Alteribacillus sp. HJP-4]|uniref:fructosamine kinase family protein n=1 Tax=Alteribacillus sp. HJP-4 TaxID=2775394 RepID=UPI0035CD2A99
MNAKLEKSLNAIGVNEKVLDVKEITGGSISSAYLVNTKSQRYFIKWHDEAPTDFFRQEAFGLEFLKEPDALPVPEVYGWGKKFIVMEPVSGNATSHSDELLGRGLAALHSVTGTFFGLEEDNYIGELPQGNSWEVSWIDFLREQRLRPQIDLARMLGRLPLERARKANYILNHLSKWVPKDRQAVKLHGDLWGGNWITGKKGIPYLIDPAVWYGDYEFELAFTFLFGGFSKRVYDAYGEIIPISSEFKERMPLYQLYYLFVHLNIFGEAYGGKVDAILSAYTK